MNYNRPIIITLLAVLSLCSVIARANDNADFDIFTSHINDRMNQIQADIDKRGVTTTTQRQAGGATITVAKNYPVVPYDPNHPNVKKQSSFNIKANAKTLAGRFARGLNAVALTYAVADMVGDGVDFVLDPENNAVRYKVETPVGYWTDYFKRGKYATYQEAAQYNCDNNGVNHPQKPRYKTQKPVLDRGELIMSLTCQRSDGYQDEWGGSVKFIETEDKERTIPLDTIANHVINNEDNSTTNVITNNYYNTVNETIIEQITNGEHDNDIETAVRNVSQPDDSSSPNDKTDKEQPQEQPQEQPSDENKPQDESKPFELPAFCDWAKPVCDWIDWTKQDAKKDTDTQIDIDDDENKIDFKPLAEKSYITLPKTCPPNPRISFNMPFVGAQTLEFPLDKFCEAFALFKVVVILFAYIRALAIVGQGL